MNLKFYQKILSRFTPVTVKRLSSSIHPQLLVQYYQGEWLLETGNALYSKGMSYAPFAHAFKSVRRELLDVNSFLLLGTGLASALYLLQNQYKVYPRTTLVDYDEQILELSKDVLDINHEKVKLVCQSAETFLEQNSKTFDLIGVDLFKDMTIDSSIFKKPFLDLLLNACHKKSICILNCIFSSVPDEHDALKMLDSRFNTEVINYRRNRIIILRPT